MTFNNLSNTIFQTAGRRFPGCLQSPFPKLSSQGMPSFVPKSVISKFLGTIIFVWSNLPAMVVTRFAGFFKALLSVHNRSAENSINSTSGILSTQRFKQKSFSGAGEIMIDGQVYQAARLHDSSGTIQSPSMSKSIHSRFFQY